MKLITHLEPSQLRLGYLGCLALVAGRQLDSRQGLVDRLSRFLFQRIEADDPRFPRFLELVDPKELERLIPPPDEKAESLHQIFRVHSSEQKLSYPLQVLWLAQRVLPSHVGPLAEKNVDYILRMGRSFEILTTGYALSEKGVFLQNFLQQTLPGIENGAPEANPFNIAARPALKLFFLYDLLSVDVLTPHLLYEFSHLPSGDLPNAPKLIGRAAVRLVDVLEAHSDITNAQSIAECRAYAERLRGKGVAKNQAQPRYHHLFELQLLDRVETELAGRRAVPSRANQACSIANEKLARLREDPLNQADLLDQNFFGWAADIYQHTARPCSDERRQLLYFARGFDFLQREIGFTPGRTVALAGCLLAWEDGWIIEVDEMFDLLRRMAAGPWRPYLEYSGGSRLDQEFLIKIKPGLIKTLEDSLSTAPTCPH